MFEEWLKQLGWLQYAYQGHHHSPLYPYINQLEWLGHFILKEENVKKIQQTPPEQMYRYYSVK